MGIDILIAIILSLVSVSSISIEDKSAIVECIGVAPIIAPVEDAPAPQITPTPVTPQSSPAASA